MTPLEAFCDFSGRFLTDEQSKPLIIEPWQRQVLADYFAGTRELVTILPKKSGKTSVFAAVALWHVLTTQFADVAVLAAARDQAKKLLDQLTGYIHRSESLRQRLRITQRVVHCGSTHGKVAVLASDSDTLDGWGGTLALVDELGRHKTAENFGLLRDGLGPRNGQLVAFSTASDDEESALGLVRSKAFALPGFTRDPANPKHKFVRTDDFAFHEWSLDPGDDVDDLALVKLANPASWVDLEELRARRDSPSMQDWQWKRFTCGLWVAGEDSAISGKEWAACADGSAVIPDGAEGVVVGVDLGWKWDTSAFVPVWRPAGVARPTPRIWGWLTMDGIMVGPSGDVPAPEPPPGYDPDNHLTIIGEPTILTPPQDGTSLDAEDVFGACAMYAKRYPGCMFVLDPEAGGEQLAQRIERELEGVDVHTFSQKTLPMCGASQRLAEDISAGRLRYDPGTCEELSRHVLAASAKFVGPMWRFVKPKGKKLPIDGCVALAMSIDVLASRPPPRRSVYEAYYGQAQDE